MATSTLVRNPAVRWRHWRSNPIAVPNAKAAAKARKL